MSRSRRYEPVAEERVIASSHSPEECRSLLMRWCDQCQNGEDRAHEGLVYRPFGEGEFRAFYQFDSPKITRHYYYKNYFLRIWLTDRLDGGCDIHYRRELDTLKGRLYKPFGYLMMGLSVIWFILTLSVETAWAFTMALLMLVTGALTAFYRVEKKEQGEDAGRLLEKAVTIARWTEE